MAYYKPEGLDDSNFAYPFEKECDRVIRHPDGGVSTIIRNHDITEEEREKIVFDFYYKLFKFSQNH